VRQEEINKIEQRGWKGKKRRQVIAYWKNPWDPGRGERVLISPKSGLCAKSGALPHQTRARHQRRIFSANYFLSVSTKLAQGAGVNKAQGKKYI
jgi:hypothetical protein